MMTYVCMYVCMYVIFSSSFRFLYVRKKLYMKLIVCLSFYKFMGILYIYKNRLYLNSCVMAFKVIFDNVFILDFYEILSNCPIIWIFSCFISIMCIYLLNNNL